LNAQNTYIHTTYKQYGHPALYFAAQGRHWDTLELLLEAKADPDLTDKAI